MGERIAVAMSGGVDSSVAAVLLREQGYDLLGLTLRLHSWSDPGDERDAAAVAARLGFGHRVLDGSDTFCHCVMDSFAAAYENGRTPNPCIDCNRHVKFGLLLERALELGCNGISTGHYVRSHLDEASGRWLLQTALHPEKDQSYVLYCLTQNQLARSRFPLGGLAKEEIRAIALEEGLVSAGRRDSQDICFVPDGDHAAFIRRHTGRDYPAGDFVAPDGRVLGRHGGIVRYTIGQRRGLGVSSADGRLYVTHIDPAANTVTLGPNEGLFSRVLEAREINFIPFDRLDAPLRVQAKVRYRQQGQPATVEQIGPDRIRVTFDRPQRAVTAGQAVVLYDGDVVIGGGIIDGIAEG